MSEDTAKAGKVKKPAKPVAVPKPAGPEVFKKIIRIAESDLDGDKKLTHALTRIRGISWSYANAIRKVLNLPDIKFADVSDEQVAKIKDCLNDPTKFGIPAWMYNKRKERVTGKNYHLLASELILSQRMDVESLKAKRCYRGVRHIHSYKVRGQRTRSRGANVRGRVGSTVGVVKRKIMPQKTEKE